MCCVRRWNGTFTGDGREVTSRGGDTRDKFNFAHRSSIDLSAAMLLRAAPRGNSCQLWASCQLSTDNRIFKFELWNVEKKRDWISN